MEWLDALILEYLNPNRTEVSRLSETELTVISEHVIKESNRIQVRIKNEIFSLRRKRQIRLLVRKYHSTLIFLLDTIVEYQKHSAFELKVLSKTAEVVVKCLDELLSFIEKRFSNYLSLDERVPITYLLVCRKELQLKLKQLQKLRIDSREIQEVLKAVVDELAASLSLQSRSRVTFRQVLYERTLLNDLKAVDYSDQRSLFTLLDHKLMELNFNSPLYSSLLIKRIASQIEKQEGLSQKLSLMVYFFKQCNQMYSNEKLFFNPEVQPLKKALENWFINEIRYLEKQIELAATSNSEEVSPVDKHENKLECDLSADQIGIILRAADEARVVRSRSMSLVFQRIVPHLSTAFKRDLSYQSVRSKSYNAEENDKDIAILTLEKMIKKIRSY